MRADKTDDLLEIESELLEFEYLASNKNYGEAVAKLLKILEGNLAHATSKAMWDFNQLHQEDLAHVCTRLASAAFDLMLQDSLRIPREVFFRLIRSASTFHQIVGATHFRDSNHTMKLILRRSGQEINAETLYRLLFLWSPYSDIQLPWRVLNSKFPEEIGATVLQGLNYFWYGSEHSNLAVNELVDLLADGSIELIYKPEDCFTFAQVWMFLSYKTSSQKRKAREAVNESYLRWINENRINKEALSNRLLVANGKPKCVFFVESMNANHAMYRPLVARINSLKEKFFVVGAGFPDWVDGVSKSLFDGFIELEVDIRKLSNNLDKLRKSGASVIIFSSIGMSHQGPLMSNIRLAPLQLALPGHCDLPESAEIDYFVAHSEAIGHVEGSKQCIANYDFVAWKDIRGESSFELARIRAKSKEIESEVVKVGIPCSLMKLSWSLIEALVRIDKGSSKVVEFNFFPNANKMFRSQLER